jgi:imidazolonepropionase
MADVGSIKAGAVAIKEGTFAGVGTVEEIARDFQSQMIIDASGRVVCPGFVDPHTHIVFAGDRLDEFELKIKGADYLEILAGGGGIISTVRKTREASIAELVRLGLERLDKMLACGTTACEIKTGYGLNLETEIKMLEVIAALDLKHCIDIVPTFLAAHAVPPEFKDDVDGYVGLICDEIMPAAWRWYEQSHFKRGNVSLYADVFCEKKAFDIEQSRRIFERARQLGFALKAHVDEFTNLGGSELMINLGATSIDHLDAISIEEITLLSQSETIGIITPAVNFNFGSAHYAPARRLIDAGCSIALSTDFNPGSAPSPSQPMTMAIACRYQKLLPSETLNAATINAAYSIGSAVRFGSIEVGKSADLLMCDVPDYRQLAYEFGGNLINRIFKAGRDVTAAREI